MNGGGLFLVSYSSVPRGKTAGARDVASGVVASSLSLPLAFFLKLIGELTYMRFWCRLLAFFRHTFNSASLRSLIYLFFLLLSCDLGDAAAGTSFPLLGLVPRSGVHVWLLVSSFDYGLDVWL